MTMERQLRPDLPMPRVKLIDRDGNAFAILGACRRAARAAGWTDSDWRAFVAVATKHDYDFLLCEVMTYFDVE